MKILISTSKVKKPSSNQVVRAKKVLKKLASAKKKISKEREKALVIRVRKLEEKVDSAKKKFAELTEKYQIKIARLETRLERASSTLLGK
jgi:hypothetical protein